MVYTTGVFVSSRFRSAFDVELYLTFRRLLHAGLSLAAGTTFNGIYTVLGSKPYHQSLLVRGSALVCWCLL
jgi:hypothetical protein